MGLGGDRVGRGARQRGRGPWVGRTQTQEHTGFLVEALQAVYKLGIVLCYLVIIVLGVRVGIVRQLRDNTEPDTLAMASLAEDVANTCEIKLCLHWICAGWEQTARHHNLLTAYMNIMNYCEFAGSGLQQLYI